MEVIDQGSYRVRSYATLLDEVTTIVHTSLSTLRLLTPYYLN